MRAKHLLVGLGLVSIGILGGCGGASTTNGTARLRALSVVTNPTRIDFFTDVNLLGQNMAAGQFGGYLTQQSGFVGVGVRQAGTTNTIATMNLTALRDRSYTLAAYPGQGGVVIMSVLDDTANPAAGKFKLRLLHLNRGAANVDVYFTAPSVNLNTVNPVLTNVSAENVTNYVELAGGAASSIRLTTTGTKNVIGQEILTTPAVGASRTVVFYSDGGAKTLLMNDRG